MMAVVNLVLLFGVLFNSSFLRKFFWTVCVHDFQQSERKTELFSHPEKGITKQININKIIFLIQWVLDNVEYIHSGLKFVRAVHATQMVCKSIGNKRGLCQACLSSYRSS